MLTMTRNILRNLVSPAATRQHPTTVRSPFESTRGQLTNDMAACTLCGTCAVKCPSQCIQVDKKSATWCYDPYACVLCGVCTEFCPAGSLRQGREYPRPVMAKTPVVLQGTVKKKTE